MTVGRWPVVEITATTAELHDRPPGDEAALWWCRPSAPAVVLGRSQDGGDLDEPAALRLGLDVTRRRSGGTAVVVIPTEMVWLDLIVPVGATAWAGDVRASMDWFGTVWQAGLAGMGIIGTRHSGPVVRPHGSQAVCFAGRGPGEVIDAAGAKLVGLSQRRTATTVRIQSMCHLVWRADLYGDLFPGLAVTDIEDSVATVSHPAFAVVAAVTAALAAAVAAR